MVERFRVAGLVVGLVLLSGALAALGGDLYGFARDGFYQSAAAAQIWFDIHATSLVGFGAIVEKRISPALWADVLVPLLSQPAWLVLGVPGAALAALCRPRRAAAAVASDVATRDQKR